MSVIGVLTATLSLATSGISESYSQNTNAYCLDFRQDYGSIIDCFVSDKLCQEYAKDLAHDVSILSSMPRIRKVINYIRALIA